MTPLCRLINLIFFGANAERCLANMLNGPNEEGTCGCGCLHKPSSERAGRREESIGMHSHTLSWLSLERLTRESRLKSLLLVVFNDERQETCL